MDADKVFMKASPCTILVVGKQACLKHVQNTLYPPRFEPTFPVAYLTLPSFFF